MKVAIINYGASNILSVVLALQRLRVMASVTSDSEQIKDASHIILPGVGNASSAMANLKEKGLIDEIKNAPKPFLGICLGFQLLYESSEEGETECLGIFKGKVRKITGNFKVPHIGWSKVSYQRGELLKGIEKDYWLYFVHSYSAPISDETSGITVYGEPFSSASEYKNFFGVQFHPERSADVGEKILRNFLKL